MREFGGLDVLVNNAGVYSFGPLESVTEAESHRQYNTNALGTLLATPEAVKLFGEKGGSIISIGTAGTQNPGPAMVLYLSTKSSIDIITRVLAKELGPKKIRVNSINPGGTETEGAHALGVMGSEFEKHLISQTPLGRFGRPEDIAPVTVSCRLKRRAGSQARSSSLQVACARNSKGPPSSGLREETKKTTTRFPELLTSSPP